MVKSLTIGLVDDGVATWNPVSDGNLLVTGGAGCGKTWWLTHTLIPGLNEMGQRVYMFDGYVDRGYTKPVQGVIPVNDPTSILEEPDSFLIIDHVNPGLEDDSALMETVRESDARIPIILSVQLVPDREQWSAWAELDIMVPSLRPSAVPHTTASRSVVRSPQNRRSNCNSSTIRKDFPDGGQLHREAVSLGRWGTGNLRRSPERCSRAFHPTSGRACSSTFSRHATGITPPAAWSITRGF